MDTTTLPQVFRKFPPDFYRNLRTKYPQVPKGVRIDNVRRALKRPKLDPKPVAFYTYNLFDQLISFDTDGSQIEERKGDGTPQQCLVLSNGCVVTTINGAIFKNIVIDTYNPSTGDKQTVSLPQEEQTDEVYSLLEFPKNYVCVYRNSSVFVFDPLNPFTTFARKTICSHQYQQFNGQLYLWCNIQKTWTILSGASLETTKIIKPELTFDEKCIPRWVSSSSFVCMEDSSKAITWSPALPAIRVGLFNIDTNTFTPFPLKSYANGSFGKIMHYVDRCFVLLMQWPSWAEQSTDVRMTVFCTKKNEILFSETMLDNRTTGLAAMNEFVGGFQWPYVQLKFSNLLNIQVYNMDTRIIEFNYPISVLTVKDPIKACFMGDLSIITIQQQIIVRHFKQIKTKQLMFGKVFYPLFQDELVPDAPALVEEEKEGKVGEVAKGEKETPSCGLRIVIDPPIEEAKPIVVEEPKSEVVVEAKKETNSSETPKVEEILKPETKPTPPTPETGNGNCSIM